MRLRAGTHRRGSGHLFPPCTGLVFYGFWAFLAWAPCSSFPSPVRLHFFPAVLSSGLMFVMLYWQLERPSSSASFGASSICASCWSIPSRMAACFWSRFCCASPRRRDADRHRRTGHRSPAQPRLRPARAAFIVRARCFSPRSTSCFRPERAACWSAFSSARTSGKP